MNFYYVFGATLGSITGFALALLMDLGLENAVTVAVGGFVISILIELVTGKGV